MSEPPLEILCVDDEDALLDITRIFLEKNGDLQVTTATSAYDALDLMKKKHFDAVVSDYEMPGMNGIDLLKEIRTRGNSVSFIIFTGRGREEVVIEAINNGVDFYLQKGGDPKSQFVELRHKILAAVHRRRSDSALRASEERYRTVVEGQTEFISRFLPDGTHVFVNEAYCRYFWRKRADIIGKKFIPRIPEDDLQRVRAHFKSLTPDAPVGFIEHRIIMDDGSIRWQRWNDRAIYDRNGDVVEYQSVGRDVTELKEAEVAKRESDQRLQAIIQGSPVLHFFIDKNHRIIHWNHALEIYSGLHEQEMIGTTDHWKAFYSSIRPCLVDLLLDGRDEDIARWYGDKFKKITSLPHAYGVVDFFPNLGPRGVWLLFTAAAIRDEKGEIIGGIETLEDISAQKEAEIALEQTSIRLREIIEHLPDPTFAIDSDGRVIAWNRAMAALSGCPAPSILNKGERAYARAMYNSSRPMLVDFFFGEREEISKHYQSMKEEGDAITAETWMIPLQGRKVVFWGKASPLYDRDGSIAGAIETIHDITERRVLEEQLNEKNVELERYLSTLKRANTKLHFLNSLNRHDILSQVTLLRSYIDCARGLSTEVPAPLGVLLVRLEDVARTISQQIEFSRYYQEIGLNTPEWQDLTAVINRAAGMIPGLPIQIIPCCNGIQVYADPLLVQAFFNIIENTVQHGKGATEVRFLCRVEGNNLIISCEDNGIGVPANEKESIFTHGYWKKTGYGLFLISEILAITRITIQETGEPGKGATFEIIVPDDSYRLTDTPG